MSSSLNLDPKNLMLLAALGIGAYWLVSRPARASTRPGTGSGTVGGMAPRPNPPSSSSNLLNGVLSGLGTYFKGGATGATYGTTEIPNDDLPGQPGYGWTYYSDGTAIGPDGSYYFNGLPVWSPSTTDAVAANPV